MDRISKFLKRLSQEERKSVSEALEGIQAGTFKNLDVKKLTGRSGLFRVRLGSIRIVLSKEGNSIRILLIDRRSEDTYKNL